MDPWPHRYILQDITQASMTMGLFFPGLRVMSIIQEYLASEDGKKFKDSAIFDPVTRSAKIPDIRSRTSCGRRPKEFWADWDHKVYTGDDWYINQVPLDWNPAIRPMIAKRKSLPFLDFQISCINLTTSLPRRRYRTGESGTPPRQLPGLRHRQHGAPPAREIRPLHQVQQRQAVHGGHAARVAQSRGLAGPTPRRRASTQRAGPSRRGLRSSGSGRRRTTTP